MLGQQLTKEEVEEFMKEADVDGNGKLDYDEFVKMMLQQWPPNWHIVFFYIYNLQPKYTSITNIESTKKNSLRNIYSQDVPM